MSRGHEGLGYLPYAQVLRWTVPGVSGAHALQPVVRSCTWVPMCVAGRLKVRVHTNTERDHVREIKKNRATGWSGRPMTKW